MSLGNGIVFVSTMNVLIMLQAAVVQMELKTVLKETQIGFHTTLPLMLISHVVMMGIKGLTLLRWIRMFIRLETVKQV